MMILLSKCYFFTMEQKAKIREITRKGKEPGPILRLKIELLEDISFDFKNCLNIQWMEHYHKLKYHYDKHGIYDITHDSSTPLFNKFINKNGEIYRSFQENAKTNNPNHVACLKIDLLQGLDFEA